ncbi:MAG TPA: hypothetical protein VNB49_07645 [Candidatus Dormibacteraeota bacterium]|nr:hypothetical protein [Candidatus Dormibacteraeota bacterium]
MNRILSATAFAGECRGKEQKRRAMLAVGELYLTGIRGRALHLALNNKTTEPGGFVYSFVSGQSIPVPQ